VQPQLRKVAKASSNPTAARFVVFLVLVLTLAVGGYLMLTTAVNENAYQVRALREEAKVLGYEIAYLRSEIAQASSATSLSAKAHGLQMRPNPHPAQLSMVDGAVAGKPKEVTGEEIPSVRYRSQDELLERREELDQLAKEKQAKEKAEAKAKKAAAQAEAKAKEEAGKKQANAQGLASIGN
jgi:hypothetical protein